MLKLKNILFLTFFLFLFNIGIINAFDKCIVCQNIMEQAEEHFHKSEPKDFVLRELEMECLYAGQICDDRDVSMFCINQVKENIDLIYDDFRKEMKPHDICRSLKSCE